MRGTGSGKSTLAKILTEHQLIMRKINGRVLLDDIDGPHRELQIGHELSETTHPNFAMDQREGLVYPFIL